MSIKIVLLSVYVYTNLLVRPYLCYICRFGYNNINITDQYIILIRPFNTVLNKLIKCSPLLSVSNLVSTEQLALHYTTFEISVQSYIIKIKKKFKIKKKIKNKKN